MVEKHVVSGLLMPKATAVWMIENTLLTFGQIADFTGLHEIEIQALADEEVGRGIVGRNPVENHELTQDELDKATANSDYRMRMARTDLPTVKLRAKGPRYTPVSKRADKPDAIAYILKHHPEISDAQICKLVGTTKPTIDAVRTRSHPNSANLRPRHPVDLGLCTYAELEGALKKGLKAAGKDVGEIEAQKQKMYESQEKDESADNSSGFDFSNFVSKTGTGTDNNSGE
ncbi:cell cycle transcriptional regulator TrcR [Micavibrio aeruginosavorus]|uniref:cell cycle transcriptional regulator TrcR n=1 Tax=Micavibrio aeruginosavorus TaxID=349221 RepID=UPI003F4AB201